MFSNLLESKLKNDAVPTKGNLCVHIYIKTLELIFNHFNYIIDLLARRPSEVLSDSKELVMAQEIVPSASGIFHRKRLQSEGNTFSMCRCFIC